MMTMVSYREDDIPELTEAEKAELRALAERPDSEIDYSDIPPLTEDFWQRAVLWKDLAHTNRLRVELERRSAIQQELIPHEQVMAEMRALIAARKHT